MRFVAAAVSGSAGVLTGLVLGYSLWGLEMTDLNMTLAKTQRELTTTKSWLLDEIRSSDERVEKVTATLTKALADLTKARADLARTNAALKQTGQASRE